MARWLGLDISSRSVRVALVRSTYRRTEIEALREEQIADHETASAAIRAAVHGLKTDAIAASIPGRRAFMRLLSLPAAAQRELANVLSFEVESTLPVEMDDAVMDHRILPKIAGDDPTQLPILAAVAYTEEVRDRIGLVLRGAGHEPQRVGVGPLPYANLSSVIPALSRETPVAILDLDEEHADFVVLRGGQPRFIRSLSRGSSGFPAESGAMALELKQTAGAWRMQGGAPLEALFVVGGGRQIQGIDTWLQAQLDVPVVDLPKPNLDGITDQQQAMLPRYAKAISLALGLSRRPVDLDLRQGPLATQQSYQFLRDKTPLLSGLAAAIFVSFFFSVIAEQQALDAEQQSLEAQLEVATEAHFGKATRDPKTAGTYLDDVIAGRTGDPVPEVDAFDVMVELSERIPDTIVHDIAEFDFNRGNVSIKGIVPTIEDANLVKSKMAEHKCFQDVNITRTTQLKKQDKQKYTLELTVECASDKKDAKSKKGKKKAKGGK